MEIIKVIKSGGVVYAITKENGKLFIYSKGKKRLLPLIDKTIYLKGKEDVKSEYDAEELVKQGKITKLPPEKIKELFIEHLGKEKYCKIISGTENIELCERVERVEEKIKKAGLMKSAVGYDSLVPRNAKKKDEVLVAGEIYELYEGDEYLYAEKSRSLGDDYCVYSYKFKKDLSLRDIRKLLYIESIIQESVLARLLDEINDSKLSEKVAEAEIMLNIFNADSSDDELEDYLRKKARIRIEGRLLDLHLDEVSTRKPKKIPLSWADDRLIEIVGVKRWLEMENKILSALEKKTREMEWLECDNSGFTFTTGFDRKKIRECQKVIWHNKNNYEKIATYISLLWAEELPIEAIEYILQKYF